MSDSLLSFVDAELHLARGRSLPSKKNPLSKRNALCPASTTDTFLPASTTNTLFPSHREEQASSVVILAEGPVSSGSGFYDL